MIKKFVKKFIDSRPALELEFQTKEPTGYDDLVKRLITLLAGESDWWASEYPDPERITRIDHGHYQGTELYIIGAKGYQPSTYWAIAVSYGSCSGCDTYQAIGGYRDKVTAQDAKEYADLMLHMVQSMKQISGYGMVTVEKEEAA